VVAKEVKIERRRLVEAINFLHGSATFRLGEKDFAPLEDLTGGKAPSRRNATPDSDFKKYSELLYNALIAPLRTQLQGKRYVGIAPSGMLHMLPFQLLGHTNPDGRFVMAIEEYAMFYHYNEVDDRMLMSPDSIRILALGNADGSLPATEQEMGHISTHFPETHSKTGEHATEAFVKQQIKSYNVLHFATHGYLDMANKLNSYLLLSPSEEHEEDGRLTVQEVMRLSLSGYYLVTLSACETAVSDPKKEWPVSPVSEFLIAGANSVVGSLWKVDDAATGLLMATFYRHLSEGTDKVDALRMAQLELSQHAAYSHPYYWAPFILVGNW
jgi:CHAT domain-containing protein